MRYIPIIFYLFLATGCSLFNAGHKSHLETAVSKQNQQLEHVLGLEQSRSGNLSRSWAHDSMIFRVYMLADGPYKINPDSGISGNKAWIYLQGAKIRSGCTQDSSETHQLGEKDRLSVHSESGQSNRKQENKDNKRIGLPLGWYIVPVLLLIAWIFYKKIT